MYVLEVPRVERLQFSFPGQVATSIGDHTQPVVVTVSFIYI